ncbi:MAG: hypothetical protein K8L91_03675 [Anaerolineae bacterium]|nr:hypothetical protein [Anaerolineae bacterium]
MDSDFFSLCLVVVPFLQPLVLFAFALNLAANEIRSPPVRIQIMGWCWGIYALLSRGAIYVTLSDSDIVTDHWVRCLVPIGLAAGGWMLAAFSYGSNPPPAPWDTRKIEFLSRLSLFLEILTWVAVYCLFQAFVDSMRYS